MVVAQPVFLFLETCVLGFLLGALYDVFRILRLALPHGRAVVFIEDVIYFFLLTVISFSYVLLRADGVLRVFLLLGELLGAVVYFFSLSIVIMRTARLIIQVVKAVLLFIYRITLRPLWRLAKHLCKGIRRFGIFLKSRYKIISLKHKKHLKSPLEAVYNDDI